MRGFSAHYPEEFGARDMLLKLAGTSPWPRSHALHLCAAHVEGAGGGTKQELPGFSLYIGACHLPHSLRATSAVPRKMN